MVLLMSNTTTTRCYRCNAEGELHGCGSDALVERRDTPGAAFCFDCNNAVAIENARRGY